MSKPFQFSIRRMFLAVTRFCMAMAAFGWVWTSAGPGSNEVATVIGLCAVGAAFGGAFGTVVRRPILFAVIGAVLLPFGVMVYGFISYFSTPGC
jgi:hypothetical protein